MNITSVLIALALVLALPVYEESLGELVGPVLLTGSGYTIMSDGVEPVQLRLTMSASGPESDMSLLVAGGTLVYGDVEFDATSLDATFLRGVTFIQISGLAQNQTDHVVVNLLGRLVEEKFDESLYFITGTLGSENNVGKTVLGASFSQLAAPSIQIDTSKVDDNNSNTVMILSGPRFEGGPDGYLSSTSITSQFGKSVLITNEDTIPHKFVSGKILNWTYVRNGDPIVCDEDGMLDLAIQKELKTDTHLQKGEIITFTVPDEPTRSARHNANDANVDSSCSFVRDGYTETTLEPSESVRITPPELGFFRLLDVEHPWILLDIISVK